MQPHNKTTRQQDNKTTTQPNGNERLCDSKNFESCIQCDRNLFIMDCTTLRM